MVIGKCRGHTSSAFFCKHAATNSLNDLEKLPSNCGGSFFGIKNKTFIGWMFEFGGCPTANSIAVMPRDQMSALKSYPVCWITSGAIQNGVPTKVFFFVIVAEIVDETPKSASFTSPVAVIKTLAAYHVC